jgi:hypothetical protein
MDLPRSVSLSRAELVEAGFADGELARARRRGELWRLRRGRYTTVPPPEDRMARHAAVVRSAVPALAPEAVVSHLSAAALHGLPSWGGSLCRVHVSRDRAGGGRIDPLLHVHPARLAADEVEEREGCRVTTVARTVVDCARTLPFEQGVVIADAALSARRVTPAGLAEALHRRPRRRGNALAARVLAFADGRAESVGESRSRVAIWRAGLPAPELQWVVGGIGRVDFAWPARRTVGEFDGLVKYGRLLRPGQDPADVLVAEKLREDALRAEGLGVARWTWADLDPFTEVAERLARQFALGTSHAVR